MEQNFKCSTTPVWDGVPIDCRIVTVTIADNPAKFYWARAFVGQQRQVMEIQPRPGEFFYIDNADGLAIHKVTNGGHMQLPHRSITVEPHTNIIPVDQDNVVYPTPDKMMAEKLRIEDFCTKLFGKEYLDTMERYSKALENIRSGKLKIYKA